MRQENKTDTCFQKYFELRKSFCCFISALSLQCLLCLMCQCIDDQKDMMLVRKNIGKREKLFFSWGQPGLLPALMLLHGVEELAQLGNATDFSRMPMDALCIDLVHSLESLPGNIVSPHPARLGGILVNSYSRTSFSNFAVNR